MDDFLRNAVIRDLRRRWMMCEERKEALRRASTSVLKIKKDGTVQKRTCTKTGEKVDVYSHSYTCEYCNTSGILKKNAKVDHVDPVVPYHLKQAEIGEGKDFTLGMYVDRLFCDEDGLQVLCKPCHDLKTSLESKIRVRWRKIKKGESLPEPKPFNGRDFKDYEI